MRNAAAALVVFLGGFAIMVLEIIGVKLLQKHFGSSFLLWVNQIGVVMTALAVGYYLGGALADRFQRLARLAWLLLPAGAVTCLIPDFADPLVQAIIDRHPPGPIPLVWQTLDPVVGSALIFLLPCLALAALPPFMIRLATQRVAHVGRTSGMIIAASTVGSIAGVFVSGYYLLDHLSLSAIFRATGGLAMVLGGLCVLLDFWFAERGEAGGESGSGCHDGKLPSVKPAEDQA